MNWVNKIVKVNKLKEADSPDFPAESAEDFNYGQCNEDVSVPVGYDLEGMLLREPLVGGCLFIERHKRNGIVSAGIFQTSEIKEIKGDSKTLTVITANSVYKLTVSISALN